jgi:hypothetical protein
MKNFVKFSLITAISIPMLAGCAETGPSALDLSIQKVCIKMNNASFRSDLYGLFSKDNLAAWTQDLDDETSAEFSAIIQPIVNSSFSVSLVESSSSFFGKAKVASFPALEELQIRCSTLGLPVKLPESYSQYVD